MSKGWCAVYRAWASAITRIKLSDDSNPLYFCKTDRQTGNNLKWRQQAKRLLTKHQKEFPSSGRTVGNAEVMNSPDAFRVADSCKKQPRILRRAALAQDDKFWDVVEKSRLWLGSRFVSYDLISTLLRRRVKRSAEAGNATRI